MSVFHIRTTAYKLGLFLFYFAFFFFMLGCLAPYWASISFAGYGMEFSLHEGPWVMCSLFRTTSSHFERSTSSCTIISTKHLSTWFHSVRALESFSTIILPIAFVYSIATNCCRVIPGPRTRALEIMIIIGGFCGLLGVIIYGASRKTKSIFSDWRNEVSGMYTVDSSGITVSLGFEIDWAVYITGVGSALLLVSVVVIAVGNKPIGQVALASGVVLGMTSVPQTGVVNPGYPGYAITQPEYAGHQPGYAVQGGGHPPAEGGFQPMGDPPKY